MDFKWEGTLPDVSSPMDFSQTMREAAEMMLGSVQENFNVGGRPAGWVAKKNGQRSFLRDTGRLFSSIRARWDKESFAVYTTRAEVPYIFTHQFGWGRVPERPYMVFQKEDTELIQSMFADAIVEFFQTKRRPVGTQG